MCIRDRAGSLNPLIVLQSDVDDTPLMRIHRLQLYPAARTDRLISHFFGQGMQGLLAALAVAFNIKHQANPLATLAVNSQISQILDGVEAVSYTHLIIGNKKRDFSKFSATKQQ